MRTKEELVEQMCTDYGHDIDPNWGIELYMQMKKTTLMVSCLELHQLLELNKGFWKDGLEMVLLNEDGQIERRIPTTYEKVYGLIDSLYVTKYMSMAQVFLLKGDSISCKINVL